jgi:hypothetical protein
VLPDLQQVAEAAFLQPTQQRLHVLLVGNVRHHRRRRELPAVDHLLHGVEQQLPARPVSLRRRQVRAVPALLVGVPATG